MNSCAGCFVLLMSAISYFGYRRYARPGRVYEQLGGAQTFEMPSIDRLKKCDPGETLIVVFGNPTPLDPLREATQDARRFQVRGGAVLLASDYPLRLAEFGVRIPDAPGWGVAAGARTAIAWGRPSMTMSGQAGAATSTRATAVPLSLITTNEEKSGGWTTVAQPASSEARARAGNGRQRVVGNTASPAE